MFGTFLVLALGMLSDAALNQRSAQLHASCPARPPAERKPRPANEARPIGDPAGLSYYKARRQLGPQRGDELLSLTRDASSLVTKPVLRALLAAVSAPGATPRHLPQARRLLASTFFAGLKRGEQVDVVRTYGRLRRSDAMREAFLALCEAPVMDRLGDRVRCLVIQYATGPRPNRYSHPDHLVRLQDFWATRVDSLQTDLQRLSTTGEELNDAVVEMLADVDRRFHILRTTSDLDLLTLVFGEPAGGQSFSYARFYAYGAHGHAEAVVVSPDPRVDAGWQGASPLIDQVFEVRSTDLGRYEELELLRWIESNHAVGPNERYRPADVPFSLFAHARQLGESIEPVLNMIASRRHPLPFDRTLIKRGRPASRQRRRLRAALAQAAA